MQLRRDGNTLVVVVLERPSIESFEITGNKDIKTEDLQKSLRNVGLATGKTFDRSVLEDVHAVPTDQYFSRGKYGVRIDTNVEDQSGNRVKVKIDIKEGKRAKIRQINIVGNETFKDKDILDSFELKTPELALLVQAGRPLLARVAAGRSGEAALLLHGSRLREFPDRLHAGGDRAREGRHLHHGERERRRGLQGRRGQARRHLRGAGGGAASATCWCSPGRPSPQAHHLHPGADRRTGSARTATRSPRSIRCRRRTTTTHEVALTFFVDPGNRVYVRNITFTGANRINDEVLRREMRQLEGGWLSNIVARALQAAHPAPAVREEGGASRPRRSPVAADLVDVNFKVEEGPSAQLGGGIGYSETQSFMLNGSYTDANFMGTGERIALELNAGPSARSTASRTRIRTPASMACRAPMSLDLRDVTQFISSSSDLDSQTISAGLTYGYPITEYQNIRFGVQSAQLAAAHRQWQRAAGHRVGKATTAIPSTRTANSIFGPIQFFGTQFKTAELTTGWSYRSLNRALFPDRGSRYSLSLSSTVPGSDVEYWIARSEATRYVPLWKRFSLLFNLEAAYGDALGRTTALPPYRQFFAGGPDSIRGFRESRLGPKDQNGNPYGGNLLLVGA